MMLGLAILLAGLWCAHAVPGLQPRGGCFEMPQAWTAGRNSVVKDHKLFCTLREEVNFTAPTGPVWPTFLGVGAAKSGSTALHELINQHPEVSEGNKLNSPEVNWFALSAHLGLSDYAQYFTRSPSAKAYGEKTPNYAWVHNVAYSARTLLGPNLKLVYSYRDPLEETVSWYLHQFHDDLKVSFAQFLDARLLLDGKMTACLQTHFKAMLVPSSAGSSDWATMDGIHNPAMFDWKTSEQIEHALHNECEQPVVSEVAQGRHLFGFANEFDHYTNLRRWVHVFGKKQLLCVRQYCA